MDLDPEGLFRDDSDEEDDNAQERETNKDMVVYLVDASPKMFTPATTQADEKQETYFHTIVNCITQSLKTQIIGKSYDEVAICFFNTKEKKNLQDLAGVYVYNVGDRDPLDRPTARLIKDFSSIEDTFMSNIGSRYGITAGSRENTLYNALWVAQALLRKGSVKTISKRILIFTNEDDPFGAITGAAKTDMRRTTIQRAKDAKDLGLSLELLPLSRPDEEFNMSLFYADLIGLEGDEIVEYLPSAGERLDAMTDQLKKRMMKKRRVKTLSFAITNDVCIEVNTYALIRPTTPGSCDSDDAPRATDEQIKKASSLLKRIDLKDFSVCHIANPALQRHYGILEALALGEDEMPDIKDDTLPDEVGLGRSGVVKTIEEFKASVYGENHDQEEADATAAKASRGEASKKRKAITDAASQKSAAYDWAELADNGKLKDMTVVELKRYLTAHSLPLSGKKEALISRILTHLGK
ncbi:hypothetical protein PR202_gb12504 [Eleusine coracana subsp. coracana]|uniref:DNA helicase n=1 Tax=Eleusine coracana subsp. coracana TaxID=191504 RepID=A0AAV5ER58_ELECO|nr:hypothetical protein PR202_gb12504 [Eleusine coracana subsp. coracana]